MELIILPSTKRAAAIVRRMRTDRPSRLLGDPKLLSGIDASFSADVRSPLAIWREIKNLGELPYRLFSFPDQVYGIGPSFRKIELQGDTYAASTIEAMIVWKFRPPVFTLPMLGTGNDIGALTELNCDFASSPLDSDSQLDDAIRHLVGPVLTYCRSAEKELLCQPNFRYKTNNAMHRTLGLGLGEIEGLVRLTDWRQDPDTKTLLLNQLKVARRQLLSEMKK
jgi:hypothetical protein